MPKEALTVIKEAQRDASPSASATIYDRTGLLLGVIALVVACLALGMSLASFKVTDTAVDRATISENHRRNFEVQQQTDGELIERLQHRVQELENGRKSERR